MGATASKVFKCLSFWWYCKELADYVRDTKAGVAKFVTLPDGTNPNWGSSRLEQALTTTAVMESCISPSVLLALAEGKDPAFLQDEPIMDFGSNYLFVEGLREPCTDALLEAINTAAEVEAGPFAVKISGTAMNVTGLSEGQILALQE